MDSTLQIIVERIQADGNQLTWVPELVEFDLENDFSVNEEDIDAALCKVGRLLAHYGSLSAELKAQLARKETDLENAYSVFALQIRKSAHPNDRLTEAKIREMVVTNETYRQFQSQIHQSKKDAATTENLFKSMMKKSDCLIALCYKQRAEMKNPGF